MNTADPIGQKSATAPSESPSFVTLKRRHASLIYEVLVLFGVALIAGFIGMTMLAATGQAAHPLTLQVVGFLVFGTYFTWFWTQHGQTLPMQTWHIRLVTVSGGPIGWGRAWARAIVASLWFAPGAVIGHLLGWPPKTVLWASAANVLIYGLLALALPQRQFLHDLICGTRLVNVPKVARRKTA